MSVRVSLGTSALCIHSIRQAEKVSRMTFSSMSLRTPQHEGTLEAGACRLAGEHDAVPPRSPRDPRPRGNESNRDQGRHRWLPTAMAFAASRLADKRDRGCWLRRRSGPREKAPGRRRANRVYGGAPLRFRVRNRRQVHARMRAATHRQVLAAVPATDLTDATTGRFHRHSDRTPTKSAETSRGHRRGLARMVGQPE